MHHPCLKFILVGRQVVRAERRPEALVTQALEFVPQWLTGVPFEDVIPLLRGAGEVEGGEPDLLVLQGALRVEKRSQWLNQPSGSSLPSYVGKDNLRGTAWSGSGGR